MFACNKVQQIFLICKFFGRLKKQLVFAGNNRIVLKVADNGLGMPPELMEKIFIPFFSTRKTGSGIGLSLCKQIMLLHQGNINVQSTEGIGSAFILQFAG